MSQHKLPGNSRSRFAEFLQKLKRGGFRSARDDEEPTDADGQDANKDDANREPGRSVDGSPDAASSQEKRARQRGYLRLYIGRLWGHWPLVVLLTIFALAAAGLDMIQPLFMRHIIDNILLADGTSSERLVKLHWVAAGYVVVVVLGQLLGLFRSWYQHLLNVRVILTLRRALFEKLLRLSLDKLANMKTGGIISRLTDDINTTTGLLQMAVISPGVAVVRLLIAIVILFAMNWKLALTAILVIPPIMLISYLAIRRIRPIYRAIRKEVSYVDGRVGEAFHGIRTVRAFLGERREEHEYALGHHAITRMRMFARRREIVLWSSWGFLMALVSVVITWAGGYWYLFADASIGDITAFHFYTFLLLNPVWSLVESVSELQRSLASMERVFEVLESPVDKPDSDKAVAAPARVESIEFEDVTFSYDGKTDVIRNLNLHVPGGSTIALVGRSGAGKTTLTDLVARFYDPSQGRILLNGHDLRDYQLASYRELLGIVEQEVFLFDGTVFENIAYASRASTLEQVQDAAHRANAHEFIADLPGQYQAVIGERGVKLSGGQRQRLSIARALLADPRILILDEATSNLDSESEQLIQSSLQNLIQDRTTFIIAHRLSTISHADQILVIADGQIVEQGTHAQLLGRRGMYAEMVARQSDAIG